MPVTPVSQWKGNRGPQELKLPSGNVALVRNPGLQVFIKKGMIPNSLLPIIDKAIKSAQGDGSNVAIQSADLDSKQLSEYMDFVDDVVVYSVVEPHIFPAPDDELLREEDHLYIDEVVDDDKFFILQWVVGGTKDLETFRERSAAALASLSDVQVSEATSEHSPGD